MYHILIKKKGGVYQFKMIQLHMQKSKHNTAKCVNSAQIEVRAVLAASPLPLPCDASRQAAWKLENDDGSSGEASRY